MRIYNLKKQITDDQAEALKSTFLDESCFDTLVDHDADGYDVDGNMLFRFRKNAIPYELLRSGYNAFKDGIVITNVRGVASGGSRKAIRKDGSIANTTVGNQVLSSAVGYMDASSMTRYCRKTAFVKSDFDKFSSGIPFIVFIDELYEKMCPTHYIKQLRVANSTDVNYRIADTAFTTVTVNKNFQTAAHTDSGDFPEGFGNLCVYREGNWKGAYFCLPQYRVAIDMQNCDMLFVDVHKVHGNTGFIDFDPEKDLRVSFVMYYREYMFLCKKPSEELARVKQDQGGFFKL